MDVCWTFPVLKRSYRMLSLDHARTVSIHQDHDLTLHFHACLPSLGHRPNAQYVTPVISVTTQHLSNRRRPFAETGGGKQGKTIGYASCDLPGDVWKHAVYRVDLMWVELRTKSPPVELTISFVTCFGRKPRTEDGDGAPEASLLPTSRIHPKYRMETQKQV